MDRRNFSLLAVTGFLGLAATKPSQAKSSKDKKEDVSQNLFGTYHTTGSGNSLGGKGDFSNGRFQTADGSSNHVGNSEMIFKIDGTGTAIIAASSIATDSQGHQYIEREASEYDFTYTCTNKIIEIYLTDTPWTGTFLEGPRTDRTYTRAIISANPTNIPFLAGRLSSDGRSFQLNSIGPIVSKYTDSNLDTWNGVSQYSIFGNKG